MTFKQVNELNWMKREKTHTHTRNYFIYNSFFFLISLKQMIISIFLYIYINKMNLYHLNTVQMDFLIVVVYGFFYRDKKKILRFVYMLITLLDTHTHTWLDIFFFITNHFHWSIGRKPWNKYIYCKYYGLMNITDEQKKKEIQIYKQTPE